MQSGIADSELSGIGIESAVADGITTIHIPGQYFLGCLPWTFGLGCVAGAIIGAAPLLFGATPATVIWTASTVALFVFLMLSGMALKFISRAYKIIVDDRCKRVSIGRHGLYPASEFAFDEVETIGVDWNRGHGQRAAKDAPISHVSIRLKRGGLANAYFKPWTEN